MTAVRTARARARSQGDDTHRRPHHVGARRPARRGVARPPHAHCGRRRDRDLRPVPRPGRTRRRRPPRLGRDRWIGRRRGSSPPESTPSCSPLRCLASGRSRTRSSTSTASARSGSPSARPAPHSSSSPAPGVTSTSRPSPSAPLGGRCDPPTILTTADGLPEADPAVLPPPPPGTDPGHAPIRWIYYTSGSTADPKGVQHTDQTLIAGGWGLARALDMGPDDVGSIAFPFAHIAGPDYLVTMLSIGFPAILVEAFSAPDVLPVFRQYGATMVGGSTAFYVAYLAEQRKAPERSHPSVAAPDDRRWRRQTPRDPLRGARRDRRSGRGARLRHDRGAHDLQRLAPRHRRTAGQYRRQAGRGRRGPHRHPRRAGRRAGRGGRGPGARAHGVPRLHRSRAERGRVRRGGLLPHRAIWAGSAPTGTSR